MTIDFSTIIRTRREELWMSQAALADITTLHRTTVFRYEHNQSGMTLDVLISILNALGLKLDVIEQEGATE